jgi:hypothetical protein
VTPQRATLTPVTDHLGGVVALVLRRDAYVARGPQGAFVLTHRGCHTFAGESIFQVLEQVGPHLDGRYTLAQLLEPLAGDRRDMLRDLVTGLVELDIVREVERPDPPSGHPETRFVGYFRDNPAEVFARYRDKSALVLGDGPLAALVVSACRLSGLRNIGVVDVQDETMASLSRLIDEADLVFHLSDRPISPHTALIEELCRDSGTLLAQAAAVGDDTWFGSAGAADQVTWTSGWRRLVARQPLLAKHIPAREPKDDRSAHILAARLVHSMFRLVTTPAEIDSKIIRIDRVTLAGESIACLPHPFTRPARPLTRTEFDSRITFLTNSSRLTEDTFSQRAMACVGGRLGVFGPPTEREFAQSPLHVCQVEVSDPAGQGSTYVTGAGLDFAAARYQASLHAFARYGARMVDPRRLLTSDGQPLTQPAEDPDEVLAALLNNQRTAACWSYDLVERQPKLLTPFPGNGLDGVAAAYSWRDAVTTALLGHCRQLTLLESPVAEQLDIADVPLGARGDRYRAILTAIGSATVYNVTGSLAVPTVVCYLNEHYAGSGTGLSYQDAVVDAMEEALLHYQSSASEQPEYAPDVLPAKPSSGSRQPFPTDPPVDMDFLATALKRIGRTPLVVPLDHDPEVTAIMPYAVRVVLTLDR